MVENSSKQNNDRIYSCDAFLCSETQPSQLEFDTLFFIHGHRTRKTNTALAILKNSTSI